MLLALSLSGVALALAAQAPAEPQAGVVQACLTADATLDGWPSGVFGLHRRFPGGLETRHLARFLAPEGAPAEPEGQAALAPPGPQVMLVHALGPDAPGPLLQVSINDVVIFDARSPASAAFEVLADGAPATRIPWPEYATAAAQFRATGAPRFVATEIWPVWREEAALRAQLASARRLEVRLVDAEGRPFRSAAYALAAQPLPSGELGAAVVRFADRADGVGCFDDEEPQSSEHPGALPPPQ